MKGRGRGGVCNFLFFRKIIPHPNPSPRVGRGAPFGSRRSFLKPFIIFDTPPKAIYAQLHDNYMFYLHTNA
jgi:hypothetical protein